MKFSKWMLVIGFVLGLNVFSFSGMLLFQGNAYFNQSSQLDISNVLVNPNGTGELYLDTSSLIIDLYPTYKDKGLLSSIKIQIDPYNTTTGNYLMTKGFSMIYRSDSFDAALFADRFGFRFKDPMMTGMDQYESAYVDKLYDTPLVFSYNGKVRLPAFYVFDKNAQSFNEMAFLRAGKGLSGVYLSGKDMIAYELAAFVNSSQSSYHVIGDISMSLLDLLKIGALVRYQSFNGNSSAAALSRSANLIYNGLMAQYNDFTTATTFGAFANFTLPLVSAFLETRVQLPKGTAGNIDATNDAVLIEVYGGAGTPLAFGDTEFSALFRMVTNSSRLELSLKDYNAIDIDVAKLFVLGSFTYMNDSLYSGYTNSAILATLSMRVSMLDDFISLHTAADFSQQDLVGDEYSEILFKAVLAQNDLLIQGLNLYEGLSGLVLLNSYARPTEEYYETGSTNQVTYLLPVAGVSYTPMDNFTLSFTYGYDVFGFAYDNDGVTHENMMTDTVRARTVDGTSYKYVESWYEAFVNPTFNVNASLKF